MRDHLAARIHEAYEKNRLRFNVSVYLYDEMYAIYTQYSEKFGIKRNQKC